MFKSTISMLVLAFLAVSVQGQANFCLIEHNAVRAQNGKAPFTYDNRLATAAAAHNKVMVAQNCFDHVCSNEAQPWDRISAAGYNWGSMAENIIVNQASCSDAVNGWMGDQGHRDNVLGDYANVGCAMATCANCKWQNYWTCDYASPL